MLTLHQLKVYEKALGVGAKAQEVSDAWGRRHAIVDPFRRAAQSIVLNLAEGARRRPGPDQTRSLVKEQGRSYAAESSERQLRGCSSMHPLTGISTRRSVDWDVAEGRELLSRVVAMVSGF